MAVICNSVYYDCLQEFQKDITRGIDLTEVNVDRLTENTRQKGLFASGQYVTSDFGIHAIGKFLS